MKSKLIADVIHRIGLEYNMSDEQIKEIVSSQFRFLRDIIASGDKVKTKYFNFRISDFGIFSVSERRKDWEKKHFKNKEEDVKDNSTGFTESNDS